MKEAKSYIFIANIEFFIPAILLLLSSSKTLLLLLAKIAASRDSAIHFQQLSNAPEIGSILREFFRCSRVKFWLKD